MSPRINNTEDGIWKDEYYIRSYEADVMGRASLPTLGNFMQETAWHHARRMGLGYAQLHANNQIWVLSRWLIKMYKYPRWGDKILIHTWPRGVERLFALRDFRILDESENIIGAASSAWLVLNAANRRPQRVDSLMENKNLLPDVHALKEKPGKIPPVEDPEQHPCFHVRISDLDVNNHVNNTRYIEWILDSYPLEFHRIHSIAAFEINFLTESSYEDEVSIFTERVKGADLSFKHSAVRKVDNRELFRARVVWREAYGGMQRDGTAHF